MNRLAVWAAGLMCALLVMAARAQELKQPPVEADRSTPRGTLKVLNEAMLAANGEQLRSILQASSPAEQQMVEAMVQTATAVKKLHDAAIATYGAEQAKVLTGPAASSEFLDTAIDTFEGDPATAAVVTFADVDQQPVRLVKEGEQWVVPVAGLTKDVSPATIDERLGEIRAFNGVIETVADEITQKKHRTAEEAKQAMYNRMMQAAAPQAMPTTQPATAPTTQPE